MKSATGQSRRRHLSGAGMVLMVLVLGSLATVATSIEVAHAQNRLAVGTMDHDIGDISEIVADQVSHYGDALTDLAAGITAQDRLTSTDFWAMTAPMTPSRLPGASGVALVVPASDDEVAETQALWRERGASDLTLKRTHSATQHAFVVLERSFAGEAHIAGTDLDGLTAVSDTLRLARETGVFAVGPAHVLTRDRSLPANEQQMSFTLAAPVRGRPGTADENTVRSWLVMGVRGNDFLKLLLRNEAHGAVRVQLTDTSGGEVIAQVSDGTPMDAPKLNRSRVLVVGQHTWRLNMQPTWTLLGPADRRSTDIAALAGAVVTVLLATLVGVLAGGRARAMDQVDEATAALRQDIERREALEQELQRLAFHDHLTGLANRGLFYDRVGQALRSHSRNHETFAVFFIDLDGFKQVNDELGHSAGDTVLRVVADRLRGCLRDSDTVARFGGDEFAVIVERLAAADDVNITAERIVAAVLDPIEVGRGEARVTASVGIALNRPGDSADDILREADLAMYTAKTTGKSRHVLAH